MTVALVQDELRQALGAQSLVFLSGASGSGKSTLLLAEARAAKRVSYLPQGNLLFPWLRVLDNVLIAERLRGQVLDSSLRARAEYILAKLRLSHKLLSFPRELSGGEQRRVALARCLQYQAPLYLFDEPFTGLEASLRRELLEELREFLAREQAKAILVTHDLEDLRAGERVVQL